MPNLTDTNLKPEDYAVPGGWADQIAKESQKVKTTQLRKFFNAIKKLHQETRGTGGTGDINKVKTETIKLIPQLIFAKGRDVITEDFYKLLEACLLKEGQRGKKESRFSNYKEFENFVSFLEAIVAYHKANE